MWAAHPLRETLSAAKEERDDHQDEPPHIEVQIERWPTPQSVFPSRPPSFPPYGWEQAANVAVQAQHKRLRGYAHLIDSVFSPELILQ